jgi:HPt (histidine-containing phosphotransfer) domain-containing protein
LALNPIIEIFSLVKDMSELSSQELFDQQDFLYRLDGDEELMHDIIGVFLEHTPVQASALAEALKQGDLETGAKLAHQLKGSCANLSASACSKLAAAVETAGRAGDLETACTQLNKFSQEMTRLFELLGTLGKRD